LVKTNEDFKTVGMVVVYEFKATTSQAHFAMLIDEQFQKTLLGLETIYLTMKYLFEDLGLRKMVIEILASNNDFVRYMEMYSVPIEATLLQEAKIDGFIQNVFRFSVFRDFGDKIIKRIGEKIYAS